MDGVLDMIKRGGVGWGKKISRIQFMFTVHTNTKDMFLLKFRESFKEFMAYLMQTRND